MSSHESRHRPARRGRIEILLFAGACTMGGLTVAWPQASAVAAAGPTITISAAGGAPLGVPVALGPCPSGEGSDYCFGPDPATAAVGDTVTFVNTSGAPHLHLVATGVTTHQSFEVNVDTTASTTLTVSDTFSYTDSVHTEAKGTLIVSARGAGSSSGSGGSGSLFVPPGQSLGQVTGAGAAKPHVVAGPAFGIVTGPPNVGPPGSNALPPITATPSADPGSLPAVTSPSTPPGSRAAVATAAQSDSEARPWGMYAIAGILFLLVGGGGAAFLAIRRVQRRAGEVPG